MRVRTSLTEAVTEAIKLSPLQQQALNALWVAYAKAMAGPDADYYRHKGGVEVFFGPFRAAPPRAPVATWNAIENAGYMTSKRSSERVAGDSVYVDFGRVRNGSRSWEEPVVYATPVKKA